MSSGFNPNKFIKDSEECKNHSVTQDVVPVTKTVPAKKSKTKNETVSISANTTPAEESQSSLTFLQSNTPYMAAYQETNNQLDDSINQLNILGNELMGELINVKSSKTLKNKYNYINDMTSTITNIISTKIGAIKEKNKTINDVNNIEIKRMKELKVDASAEDDNTKIMNLYDAFINTPVGALASRNAIGPSVMDATMMGGLPDVSRTSLGMDQQMWEQNLSPAENRMVLEAKGVSETVVFYDEATGNRWFEVVDKTTKQPIPNVEKPDPTYIYELDINTRGGYAKDVNRNTTYPLVVVNGGDQSILEY